MPLQFGLRQLEHFIAVTDAGSFSEAAERTSIAQPALSISIRKLEEAIGVPLFHRGTRGVSLTPAGKEFLTEAKRSLAHAERARENARLAGLGELGVVRLGFVGSAIYRVLPQRLPGFIKAFPSVRIEFTEGVSITLLQAMREGRMDAGIIRLPADGTDGFLVTEVERDDLIAVVSRTHPLAERASIDLAELANDPFIMFSSSMVPRLRNIVVDACRASGFVPRMVQEATQAFTMVGLVGTGIGVALLPRVIAQFQYDQVRFIALENREVQSRLTLALATPESGISATTMRLREFLLRQPSEGPQMIR